MKIVAYRGFSAAAPENTMKAFQSAILTGASGIQLDLHVSRDGELVIFHDDAMSRLMDGVGFIRHHTLQDLKSYRFKEAMEEETIRIPTLKEYFSWARDLPHFTVIRLQNDHFFYPNMEEAVISLVEEYGLKDKVILTSKNVSSLQMIKTFRPDFSTAYIAEKGDEEEISEIKNLSASMILINRTLLRKENMSRFKRLGLPLYVYVVDDPLVLDLCREFEVDGILTREVTDIQELLQLTNPYSEDILSTARLKPIPEEEEGQKDEEKSSPLLTAKEKFFHVHGGKKKNRNKGGVIASIIFSVISASAITFFIMRVIENMLN